MKEDVKKWLPVVKKNRESNRIDFTKSKNIQIPRMYCLTYLFNY